jgi:flagellin-specific chaperone FliS
MNPYAAYGQHPKANQTRIDVLLDLFEAALNRLAGAREALAQGDHTAAEPLLARAQILVEAIASGLDLSRGELPHNLLRLYEFAVHSIRKGDLESIDAALKVMHTLNEGFQAIRAEAVDLERKGIIPPLQEGPTLQALA